MSPSKPANGSKRAAPDSATSPAVTSTTKTDGPASKRQKRDGIANAKENNLIPTPAAAAAAAASQDFGAHMATQMTYAVEFLKTKGTPKTFQEVIDHLTLQHIPESQQRAFMEVMQRHSRIQFIPALKSKANADQQIPTWRTGTYQYKAKLPGVTNKLKLLEYLQQKKDASCTLVKDIKDGWPNCDMAIDQLEKEHKILAVRTKKDNHPRYVWLDRPELHHEVDTEFQVMWFQEKLPSADDMPKMLNALGQKATSEPKNPDHMAQKQPSKRKKGARPQRKFENEHMRNIFEQHKR
ncbi:transcription initiation factor IIE, beta subunit [Hypoxylon fragiforme]|uniref:transcription initiation factor IIE, beta subunit n=1 Tax=Hypoxylon fragiforme TaxID=63214 RepID=UPI0020C72802|nr:transcription initiation factor IIE, beta subunit [Hypoxylon fragiforme]KAI2610095.1 transcription initiation factor IIE, beta subunit [Hypoxylon fragiforme]